MLAERDPDGAAAIRPSDPQRILRALEVIESTGESLRAWHARQTPPAEDGWAALQILLMPDRDAVYAACDARFDRMMADGALAEARAVGAMGLDPALPMMKAVGLAPLLAHCRGELDLDGAVAAAKRDTAALRAPPDDLVPQPFEAGPHRCRAIFGKSFARNLFIY